MMILKIAWRNVWRNKLRSSVVILSIVMGIFAGVFAISFSLGMNNQRTENMLNTMVSHIQIHDSMFLQEPSSKHIIRSTKIDDVLAQYKEIEGVTKRLSISGMAQSAAQSTGVLINGVVPQDEKTVSDLHEQLVEGKYLEGKRNPIIIGKSLSEKLNVGLRKKLVLTFQDVNGQVVQSRFKVVGIFKSSSSTYDERVVFTRFADANRLLKAQGNYHEIAIMLNDVDQSRQIAESVANQLPKNLKVEPWQEAAPELGYADETMAMSLNIIMAIIMLALVGGIINTMLMAVLERKRELGMILCVGMNKSKVFLMIMYETVFLSLIGGPIGLLLALAFVSYFGEVGIPLTGLKEGMESFGISSVVYPAIDDQTILNIVFMVLITAIISAIIPGQRAIKLKPAEAVRSI